MTQEEAHQFLTDSLQGIFSTNLTLYLKEYYQKEFVGHYKGQDFYLAEMQQHIKFLTQHVNKFNFTIEDLVVVDNLIIAVIRFAWIDAYDKSYCEAIINIVCRTKLSKVSELWLMVDQSIEAEQDIHYNFGEAMKRFEINEKDKAEFLRRLSLSQYFYQAQWQQLSDTEKECLFYYLNGFSSKETAQMTALSHRTIETYLAAIKAKFNCSTKTELRRKLFPQEKS